MQYAIDSVTNTIVYASAPNLVQRKRYLCPVCRSPVHLRKGNKRVPYFAHESGQASPTCELYIPGTYYQDILKYNYEPQHRILNLYIKVFENNSKLKHWGLEIGIPEPDIEKGEIEIPFGRDGRRVIPVKAIGSGGWRVSVRPQSESYIIDARGIPECSWKERITQAITGIELEDFTVFHYSQNGGRRLNSKSPLFWGKQYVVVWTSNCPPQWEALKTFMEIELLEPIGIYYAAIITLPIRPVQLVEAWVQRKLKRQIDYPLAELRLIAPFPDAYLHDGTFVYNNVSKILVGITGGESTKTWDEINVYDWKTGKRQRVKGTGKIPFYFELLLNHGRYDIWLDDAVEEILQIVITDQESDLNLSTGIMFTAKNKDNDFIHKAFLHTEYINELLYQVSRGYLEIIDIDFPAGIRILIKWIDKQGSTWEKDDVWNKDLEASKKELIKLVNSLVRGKAEKMIIDAFSFGRLNYENRKKDTSTFHLPLSQKAIILANISRHCSSLVPYRVKIDFNIEEFPQEDQKILRTILSQKAWPLDYIPFLNNLLAEYKKACNRSE